MRTPEQHTHTWALKIWFQSHWHQHATITTFTLLGKAFCKILPGCRYLPPFNLKTIGSWTLVLADTAYCLTCNKCLSNSAKIHWKALKSGSYSTPNKKHLFYGPALCIRGTVTLKQVRAFPKLELSGQPRSVSPKMFGNTLPCINLSVSKGYGLVKNYCQSLLIQFCDGYTAIYRELKRKINVSRASHLEVDGGI